MNGQGFVHFFRWEEKRSVSSVNCNAWKQKRKRWATPPYFI